MRHIFDEENKLQLWLDVEAAVAEAQAAVGDIPKGAAEEIVKNANTKTVTLARTREIEEETRHDLASMVQALTEACSGGGRKYVHYGLTSMDVEDTATALQFKAAFVLIEKGLDQLETTLSTMVRKYRGQREVARTHGRHALKIQEKALRSLGLKPAGLVTQVIQRDIHAEVVVYFALLGSSLDKFATEIRNLQRSEIAEALEPFDRKRQIGSSALPSK